MWFDSMKKADLSLEGTNLEHYEAIKQNLQKLHERIQLMHQVSVRKDFPRELLVKHLAELERSSATLLELIGLVDNITFEDQMRGKA